MLSQAEVPQALVNRDHDGECCTTTRMNGKKMFSEEQSLHLPHISPASDNRIRRTDDVLVKERRSPRLARDECATQDANEESQDVERVRVVCCTSKTGGDGANDEQGGHDHPWPVPVHQRTSRKPHEQSRRESDNVGVGDFLVGEP